ncbi:MAG: hypothetical protein E7332_09765 [Clostridiales bacterium]|nr:hypothetical protein [Clostridiales bacterium]
MKNSECSKMIQILHSIYSLPPIYANALCWLLQHRFLAEELCRPDEIPEKDFESYYEQALQKNDSALLALLICYLYCRDN